MQQKTFTISEDLLSGLLEKPNACRLFLYLLVKSDSKGELAMTLSRLAQNTGLSLREVRTALSVLSRHNSDTIPTQKRHAIDIKATKRETRITICDYDSYTQTRDDERHKSDTKATQKRHKSDTKATQDLPDAEATGGNVSPETKLCEEVRKYFNDKVSESGSALPSIIDIKGKRREYVLARLKEYGMEQFKAMVDAAVSSDFLNGKTRDWKASFDWLVLPTNFQKVLEGNYTNSKRVKSLEEAMQVGLRTGEKDWSKWDNLPQEEKDDILNPRRYM